MTDLTMARNEYGEIVGTSPTDGCAPCQDLGMMNLVSPSRGPSDYPGNIWLYLDDQPVVPMSRVKSIDSGPFKTRIELYD